MNRKEEATPVDRAGPASAGELARVIRRLTRVFDAGDLGNARTADALDVLADYLQRLGPIPVTELEIPRPKRRPPEKLDVSTFRTMQIGEVRRLLDQDDLPKSTLLELARLRFGMPAARLRRLPFGEAVEAVRAAAAHEESLDIIERNAEVSGRSRNS
jgi:hypothetical protein